jgi:hypothetical protein
MRPNLEAMPEMARYQNMCKCSFTLASRLSQQWLRRTGD